jgi:methylphosphotriester-DNA--protein-cysteine methyltransferase
MVTLSSQRDFRIQRAVHFLNNEPFRTLPELAHNCQISTSRLSHLFKKEVGINIKLALRRNLNNSSINGGFRRGDFSVRSGG